MRNFPSSIAAFSCIPIVLITGCSQNNLPSQAAIQESLQEKLPPYLEIESFQIKKSENLSTETEPKIQARFTANLEIVEDLYDTAIPKNSILDFNPLAIGDKDSVEFIRKKTSKGDKLTVYGLSISEQYADTWKTRFKFDETPFNSLGSPRNQYTSDTIISGSEEEKKYKDEKKAESISKLFTERHRGHLQDGLYRHSFIINFLPYDEESGDFEGAITFLGGSKKNIKGNFSNSKLTFETTSFSSGEDTWGLGTQYSFNMDNKSPSQPILGSWKHPGKTGGEASIQLE